MDGGDHLLSRDLSHMHQEKYVFEVYKGATTQHYSMRFLRVVWGLWVVGLHEERTSLEPRTTCQPPYLLEETITSVYLPLDDHVHLFKKKKINLGSYE